jgi:hypothetical protein
MTVLCMFVRMVRIISKNFKTYVNGLQTLQQNTLHHRISRAISPRICRWNRWNLEGL